MEDVERSGVAVEIDLSQPVAVAVVFWGRRGA